MNRVNDTTQNIEGNKGETKKLRTIMLSTDVNDYDTGECASTTSKWIASHNTSILSSSVKIAAWKYCGLSIIISKQMAFEIWCLVLTCLI